MKNEKDTLPAFMLPPARSQEETAKLVLEQIAKTYHMAINMLQRKGRSTRRQIFVRHVAMWFLRTHAGFCDAEIAAAFDCCRGAVTHAVLRLERNRAQHPELKAVLDAIAQNIKHALGLS